MADFKEILQPLSADITHRVGMTAASSSSSKKVVKSFISAHVSDEKRRDPEFDEQLNARVLVLEKTRTGCKPWKRVSVKKRCSLTSRQKRRLGIGHFPKSEQRYDLFVPLHKLWCQYMQDVMQISPNSKPATLEPKVLKADYHGCIMTVARSKCPSYVGMTGIVVQETQATFKLVTQRDCVKVVPKAGSIFSFEVKGFQFNLYGSQLCCRASERSAKKFKTKPTVDL